MVRNTQDYRTPPSQAYRSLVQRAADVFAAIIALYSPDVHVARDWADISVVDAKTQHNGLLERLATPRELTATRTGTLVSATGHYLGSYWADYQEVPVPNPKKHNRVEQLHAELEAIIKEVASINWEGPTAAQPVSGEYKEKIDNGYSLPGGAPQVFVPNKLSRNSDFGNHIQDVTQIHRSW